MNSQASKPFLRIPPFPGARALSLTESQSDPTERLSDAEVDQLLDETRRARVGGDYWAAQPSLVVHGYTLLRIRDSGECGRVIAKLGADQPIVVWTDGNAGRFPSRGSVHIVKEACDPWHLVAGAELVITDADDELALITAASRTALRLVGDGPSLSGREIFRKSVERFDYVNPFTGEPMDAGEAIRLCGFWRRMIDSNRDIGSAVGFAFWKRQTVAPLLWNGSREVPFVSRAKDVEQSGAVAVWKARTPARLLAELNRLDARLIEVEDGFIRSAGLGADCVPPLSIVVDRLGAHFDPSSPSELEQLIETEPFSDELLERARRLRELIIQSGIGKYGAGASVLDRRSTDQMHVLVVGQVEDDRAVLCGRGPVNGNLDLLRRARHHAPDAYILYKPHPDVEAGHRSGSIEDDQCLEFADEIVRNKPISAVIDMADQVHVISSLAGFEALIRGKSVTTHGVPFYAGWGLTRDLGPMPNRRTARRTLDEIVAAVLLLYPRYLDPMTGLPCPPEILVRRIAEGFGARRDGMVVQFRRFQGRWKKRLARVGLG